VGRVWLVWVIFARPMSPKLLNKRQVAQLFGVSKSTIERWLQDAKLPKPRRRFGWARWYYAELEPLLKSKTKFNVLARIARR
jgi:predicted DNA-binding transcriptional regulator AlpA